MCIYVYTYMYTYIHTYICIFVSCSSSSLCIVQGVGFLRRSADAATNGRPLTPRSLCIYIYIYIHVYVYIYIYIYIYVYIIRYRTVTDRTLPEDGDTVSFHNFKSHNFKLSVSNPKSKYVAYVSVLSQNSNCQGLGRKNKDDILKPDRTWTSPQR